MTAHKPPISTRGRPRMFLNLTLSLASLAIVILLVEAGLRLLSMAPPFTLAWVGQYHTRPSENFIVDEQTGWRLRPNHEFTWLKEGRITHYRSNSQGFRSPEDFHPASETRKIIVFAGDSYTFGAGVEYEETFGALVQAHAPNRVAYNLGMPGFGVDQVWLSVRDQGLPMKPDLIVVGLVDADLERSLMPHRPAEGFDKPSFKLSHGRLLLRTREQPPKFFYRFVEEHSRILSLVRRAMRRIARNVGVGEYWTLNEAILDELQADARRAGVPVLFIYMPIGTFQPFPTIGRYMRRTGANFIDLTELKPRPPHSIYLPVDGHFSVEGHCLVADLIERWMHGHMADSTGSTQSLGQKY